ncbi:MAG TPA: zinc-dependent alcohol dehydrogenase family protein [Granulicella sp.]
MYRLEQSHGEFIETVVPDPIAKAGEVLVRIHASGVNPLDTKIRAGQAAHAKQPLPAVLGLDMAGVVEEVGEGVTGFKRGDEVFGMIGGVGGLQGSLAGLVAADARLLAHKPAKLSMREAAALPLSVITAWEGLVDRAAIHAGQKVLIHAGAGGVGHIAVQIAKAFGAEVFATVSPDKTGIVAGFSATPIDYKSLSVTEYVAKYTGGAGFDVIYDTVGGRTLDDSFAAVRHHTGHVLSCLGFGTHVLAPLSFRGATYSGVFTLLPLITGEGRLHHGEILAAAAKLADEGKLKPLLAIERFNVSTIDQAHALVERGSLGKVVVEF